MSAEGTTSGVHSCIVCDAKVMPDGRGTCNIFVKESKTLTSREAIHVKLSNVISHDLTQETVHTELLCRRCLKLLNDYDAVESSLKELEFELKTKFDETWNRFNIDVNTEILQNDTSKTPSQKKRGRPKKSPLTNPIENNLDGGSDEHILLDSGEIMDDNDLDYNPLERNRTVCRSKSIEEEDDDDDIIDEYIVKEEENEEENTLHITINTDEGNFRCRECPRTFLLTHYASEHMRKIHGIRMYICDVCGEEFEKKVDVNKHMETHIVEGELNFQCEVCKMSFMYPKQYKMHVKVHINKMHFCTVCNKKFLSRGLLEEHTNTHVGVRPYECTTCGKTFASKYCFRVHSKTHGARPRNFKCNLCSKAFLSTHHLQEHIKTHSEQKNFVCESCGKAFGTARNLEVHSIVHSGVKPHSCNLCGKTFARRAEILDHARTHTGERPFQCEVCGATFSQKSNLQSHKRATHFNDKRYKCDDCGKAFKRRRLLDYHLKSVHTGERPYQCPTCEAAFVYPEHYKKHLRIHSGEKPFKCEICGKAFNSRDNRNAHRFIHSDKKPYECKVCGQGFMRKPTLFSHMQTARHMEDTIIINRPQLPTTSSQNHSLLTEAEAEDSNVIVTDDTDTVRMILSATGASNDQILGITKDENVIVGEFAAEETATTQDEEEISITLDPSEHLVVEQGATVFHDSVLLPSQIVTQAGGTTYTHIQRGDEFVPLPGNASVQVIHIQPTTQTGSNNRAWINYFNQQ